MDDLDRLAFRLVRTVRNSYPHLLTHGFTLTDLEERLIPFRDARREMSNTGPEAWEITVLRMLSGERGYVCTDADLQLACRQALLLPSPTMALVRPWSAATVTVGDAALQLASGRAITPASEFNNGAPERPDAARLATRPALPQTSNRPMPSGTAATFGAANRQQSAQNVAVRPDQRAGESATANAQLPSNDSNGVMPVVVLPKCGCRFCGGKLPDTRKLVFCPHCGVNLTVRHCPACSTELDVNWRFCVTCGRGSDVPELPASIARLSM